MLAGLLGIDSTTISRAFAEAAQSGLGDLAGRLCAMGVGVVVSNAFAALPPPEAVRIGLGAARTRQELSGGLQVIADLLAQAPALSSTIV
jgi:SpoU rRNA methylase family enzyme